MILHLLNQTAASEALELCLRYATREDVILLLEDGVCLGLRDSVSALAIQQAAIKGVFAIGEDLAVRGLAKKIAPAIELIDYQEFVALCCEAQRVQSWN